MSFEAYDLSEQDKKVLEASQEPRAKDALMQWYITPDDAQWLTLDQIRSLGLSIEARSALEAAQSKYMQWKTEAARTVQKQTAAAALEQHQADVEASKPQDASLNNKSANNNANSGNKPGVSPPGDAKNIVHVWQDFFGEWDRTGEIQYYVRALLGGYISNTQLQEKAGVKATNALFLEKPLLFVSWVTPADWIRKNLGISRQNLVDLMQAQEKNLGWAQKQFQTNPEFRKVIAAEKLELRKLINELSKNPIHEANLFNAMQDYEKKVTARIAKLQPSIVSPTSSSGPKDLRAPKTHEARNISGLITELDTKITDATNERNAANTAKTTADTAKTKAMNTKQLYNDIKVEINGNLSATPPKSPNPSWWTNATLKSRAEALGISTATHAGITTSTIDARITTADTKLANATSQATAADTAVTKAQDKLLALEDARTKARVINTTPPAAATTAATKYGELHTAVNTLNTAHATPVTSLKDGPAMVADAEKVSLKLDEVLKNADAERAKIITNLHNTLTQTLKDASDAGLKKSEIKQNLQLEVDHANTKLTQLGTQLGVDLGKVDSKRLKEYLKTTGLRADLVAGAQKWGEKLDKMESKAAMRGLGVAMIGLAAISIGSHDTWEAKWRAAADIGLSMIPGVGALHDWNRANEGTDLNGNQLSTTDKWVRRAFALANSFNTVGLIAKWVTKAGAGGIRWSQTAVAGTRGAQFITYGTLGLLLGTTGVDLVQTAID